MRQWSIRITKPATPNSTTSELQGPHAQKMAVLNGSSVLNQVSLTSIYWRGSHLLTGASRSSYRPQTQIIWTSSFHRSASTASATGLLNYFNHYRDSQATKRQKSRTYAIPIIRASSPQSIPSSGSAKAPSPLPPRFSTSTSQYKRAQSVSQNRRRRWWSLGVIDRTLMKPLARFKIVWKSCGWRIRSTTC